MLTGHVSQYFAKDLAQIVGIKPMARLRTLTMGHRWIGVNAAGFYLDLFCILVGASCVQMDLYWVRTAGMIATLCVSGSVNAHSRYHRAS